MLNLLFSVSLDPAQQWLQLIFLLTFLNIFFISKLYLECGLHLHHFLFFKLVTDVFYLFCFNIVFNRKINLLLLSQVNNLFTPSMIVIEFFGLKPQHLIIFTLMLLFHLFYEFKSCGFIIGHVFVPGFWKFTILDSLGIFDVYEFSLLGNSHIVLLTLLFILTPPIKNSPKLITHHIVACFLIFLPHRIHNLQKHHDSVIWQKIDAGFG